MHCIVGYCYKYTHATYVLNLCGPESHIILKKYDIY